MRRSITFLLLMLIGTTAGAAEVLIPAVHRGPGAFQTVWRSEIVLTNLSPDITLPVMVTITLHPNAGAPSSVSMPLSPKETIAVPDAVREWFGVEEGGGIVRVTWDDETARIAARARIYEVGGGGEYGQGVPGLPVDALEADHYLPGLTGLDGNRTNVGVSNPHTTDVLVWIILYDTSGSSRGGFTLLVPARSYRQLNDIFSYFQAGPLNAAMIRVSSTSLPVYAYASVVRNDTGDATFVATP
jgi:hypothetical protein